MAERWDLLFTFPNLCLPNDSLFEAAGFVICSGSHRKLRHLAPTAGNAAMRRILRGFRTPRGTRYRPACFLIREDIPRSLRDTEAIRAFRNVCALSTTTAAYAMGLDAPHTAQWRVLWTDQFEFGYFVAGYSGWIQTLAGAVQGADNKVPRQQAAAQFGNPASWSVSIDQPLLDRLLRCWRRCYIQKKDRRRLLRLFRSLEIAFHASLFPADGLTSINDLGTRIALWVSAFEVLCHPGASGRIDKRRVQQLLSAAPFEMKELTARRYTISYQRTKIRVSLPEALYDDLYFARNQFLHGMPVRRTFLHYRQSTRYERVENVAPVLFNAALVSNLNALGIAGGPMDPAKVTSRNLADYIRSRQSFDRVQKGLVASGTPN